LVDIVVPIFVERLPGMKKGGGHHIVVPPLLQELTILNTTTTTPPSLGRVYRALPCGPNFVRLSIVHLSMSKLSSFADDLSPTSAMPLVDPISSAHIPQFFCTHHCTSGRPIPQDSPSHLVPRALGRRKRDGSEAQAATWPFIQQKYTRRGEGLCSG
jgi:hypothetical protein